MNRTQVSTAQGVLSSLYDLRVVLTVAIVLRLVWIALVPVNPVSDSVAYNIFAHSLAEGRGYAFPDGTLTAFWPVGTSALYAGVYKLFGANLLAIAVLNLILGVLIVLLTYALAKRHMSERVAVLAAWLIACWPLMIQFTTVLASELLFSVLLLGALYVWGSRGIPTIARAALWGALVCAATYVRPFAWPLLFILPVLDGIQYRHPRTAFVSFFVALTVFAVLFAPWVHRNQQVFKEFVLVSTNGGSNLWMGNNPQSNGGYMDMPSLAGMNEAQRDRYLGQQAKDFIRDNPAQYIGLALKRIYITFSRETIGVVWNEKSLTEKWGAAVVQPMKMLSTAFWWAILAASIFGLARLLRATGLAMISNVLVVISVFLFLVPLLTVGQDRYHVPMNSFIAVFAAYGLRGVIGARDPS